MQRKITYEQPLNERIRTFLRLDLLFNQTHAHLESDSVWNHRAAILSLLEIIAIVTRVDLKKELMKELERMAGLLEALEKNPNVDSSTLDSLLEEIYLLLDRLHSMEGQFGSDLRRNEFLTAISQRSSIPGGTCDFDLPAYHFWLNQPADKRKRELNEWLSSFECIARSIKLTLRLMRESAPPRQEIATGGFYQQSLDPSSACQILRVAVPMELPYFVEISGGKHRFTIRFLEQSAERNIQTTEDVKFELTCCVI